MCPCCRLYGTEVMQTFKMIFELLGILQVHSVKIQELGWEPMVNFKAHRFTKRLNGSCEAAKSKAWLSGRLTTNRGVVLVFAPKNLDRKIAEKRTSTKNGKVLYWVKILLTGYPCQPQTNQRILASKQFSLQNVSRVSSVSKIREISIRPKSKYNLFQVEDALLPDNSGRLPKAALWVPSEKVGPSLRFREL